MSKFKVGDKVKLLNTKDAAVNGFKIGNIYEITNIDESNTCYIEIINNDEIHGYVNDENIELVEEITTTIVITKDGITVNGNGKNLFSASCDSIDAMTYCTNDIIATKKYDMCVKEIWKNEEEKDMNKVLELYTKRKKEEIDKKYNEKVEKDYNDLELVKKYKETIREFEENMDMIYNSELNFGESTIHQCYNANDYKYELKYDLKENVYSIYRDEKAKEIKAIDDLVEEVEAQLSLSNDLDYQKEILINYGIIDKKSGKIK